MSKPVVHMVLFKFKKSVSEEDQREVYNQLLSLEQKCLHPGTNEPYILSASGGTNNSPEGLDGGFTHGYVAEFASEKDRDYYVREDPAHQAFIKDNSANFESVRVLDYEKGVY